MPGAAYQATCAIRTLIAMWMEAKGQRMTKCFLRSETAMREEGDPRADGCLPESMASGQLPRPAASFSSCRGRLLNCERLSGDGRKRLRPSYEQFAWTCNMLEIGTGRKFGGVRGQAVASRVPSIPEAFRRNRTGEPGPSQSPTYFVYVSYIGERFLSESGAPLQVLADGELSVRCWWLLSRGATSETAASCKREPFTVQMPVS